MKLRQIKLAGFKTFIDPTTISLPGQLVGIVGPNGCGKSNIMESVKWVLGSSSAKEMRATPEIAPPIARHVDRDSGTFGVESYDYGDVEIASEVGWQDYKKVADGLIALLNNTGLLHGYSFNSWSDMVTYDNAFVEEWLASPQTSLYYSLQVMGDTQDKSNVYAALDDADVDNYLEELLSNAPDCNCGE